MIFDRLHLQFPYTGLVYSLLDDSIQSSSLQHDAVVPAIPKEIEIMEMPRNIVRAGAMALVLGVAAVGTGCATMDEQTTNSEQPVQDTWITTKVTTAFATIEDVDSTDIGVETSNGVVTLTGRVDSQDQLDALVAAANRVEGVTAVDTNLVKVVAD